MDIAPLINGLLILFLIIPCSAFFVIAEYSLAISRSTRLTELEEQGHKAAKTVLRVMNDPDRFFAGTQIGVRGCVGVVYTAKIWRVVWGRFFIDELSFKY